jgi:hypothetical protein
MIDPRDTLTIERHDGAVHLVAVGIDGTDDSTPLARFRSEAASLTWRRLNARALARAEENGRRGV